MLGISLVGRDVGEVIHEARAGPASRATVHDFVGMVYATMAQALKIAALSFFKGIEKMRCCAE